MLNLTGRSRNALHSPRGSVYIAVLGVALIVAVIGISSLHVARLEVRESMALDEIARARIAARSGVECVLCKIKSDPLWRTTYSSGATGLLSNLSNNLPGTGSFSFQLIDSDGDLNDDPHDAVTIRSVGTAGNARQVVEVLLQPTGEGLSSLSAALHAGDDVNLYAITTTDQVISSNDDIYISSGGIQGNAQAVDDISGSVSGTKTKKMNPALEMPDPNGVFEYYLAIGTPITFSQISGGNLQQVVLSSTFNPYGSQVTNAQGVYVIDCQGNNLIIENARIQATIVLINPGPWTQIGSSIHWEAAIAKFPALIVQGSIIMNFTQSTALRESIIGVNFNPSHTPYAGSADSDLTDTYPSIIKGLVYATGNMTITNSSSFDGVTVVGGKVYSYSPTAFNYKSTYLNDAPPGFTAGTKMKLVPGTWKQVAY